MTFPTHCPGLRFAAVLSLGLGVATLTVRAQSAPQVPRAPERPVAGSMLEPLLPAPDGWTRAKAGSNSVVVSESCDYSFADATYLKDGMKVRVTLADTGFNAQALGLLATMVVSLPDGYTGEVPPATTVERVNVHGLPAASRWDAKDREGEFTMLIAGRFVVKAEGTKVDALATLRAIVELVDVKKVGALK